MATPQRGLFLLLIGVILCCALFVLTLLVTLDESMTLDWRWFRRQGSAADSASINVRSCGPCWALTQNRDIAHLPVVYVITPTYRRPEQMAELTRLAQTIAHVPAVHWIVVEDAEVVSPLVAELLNRFNVPFTHLCAPMPAVYRADRYFQPRGVSNRMAALNWIRRYVTEGVFYFADDDNTYDIRLFEEMRYTKKVSMWPVGLIARYGVSSPVLDLSGVVVDFYDVSSVGRYFAVDMAAFAVNIPYFLQRPNASMPFAAGLEEDGFLQSLGLSLEDIEPKAEKCTKILVWHTKALPFGPMDRRAAWKPRFKGTNIEQLQSQVI